MENIFDIEEKIDRIKSAILTHVQAKYIYLFGSYAYGKPRADSDVDIYAVIPDEAEGDMFLHGTILWDLIDFTSPEIDLILCSESKFHKLKTLSRFEETVYEKGRLLYENI